MRFDKDTKEISEKIYAHWMMTVPSVPRNKKIEIWKAAQTAQQAYEFGDKRMAYFLDEKGMECWKRHKEQNPYALWEKLEKQQIQFTFYGAKDFPKRLLRITDAPFGLYYRGRLPQEDKPTVAIIGSRKNSEYGRCMAEHFASALAKKKVTVISGMAMGIDGIGQRAALKEGGDSYGVLGSGVDVVYPVSNTALYYQLIEKGGVISESLPGTAPHAGLFPQRNRIISGLSDVVLVVEAREKSGTFITVDMALEQGREVYVIPGRCTDSLSVGCNRLLRQGAGVAISPEDILKDMGWIAEKKEKEENIHQITTKLTTSVSDIATEIIEVLDLVPCTQEDVVSALRVHGCNSSVPQIMQGLLELEMRGMIQRTAGQYRLNSTKL